MEDNEDKNKANEPLPSYSKNPKKQILFFNSFAESEEHKLREMASHTYEQRLSNLEHLRKQFYSGKRLERVITIIKGTPE